MNVPNDMIETRRVSLQKFIRLSLLILLIAILALGGIKGWRVYQKGMVLYQGVNALRVLARIPVDKMDFETLDSTMSNLQVNLNEFKQEVEPVLWLAPSLGWIPTYGSDIANSPAILEFADHLITSATASLQAGGPFLDAVNSPESDLDPAGLTELLVDAQPQLLKAREEFNQVLDAKDRIPIEQLSPRLRGIMEEIDPLLKLMDDGLLLSTTLPVVLGADGEGPKSYLLLAQNEDELRPTGGFITTVGKLVIQNGKIINLDFEGVDNGADWSKPYPVAPWQLQDYMNARVMILRDSNWSADFPTNAMWVKYLYSYNHPEPLDGVIAFDQQFLVMLLDVLGPLEVDGVSYPITSDNVIAYMRFAKEPPAGEAIPADWYRKEFISQLANSLLDRIIGGNRHDWRGLVITLMRTMNERHLLLQFDDPQVESQLARHNWDGAVRPGEGDFLMTTDTNIGFNKTNALLDVSITYDVNLTDLSNPKGSLVLTHHNHASQDVPCLQWGYKQVEGVEWYPIDRCYWTYTRVYKQAGTSLVDASPHAIPSEWILLGKDVPARVDVLENEVENVQGYGTLLVVHGGETLSTGFDFALPNSVILRGDGSGRYVYRLKVQKQPGTLANPLVIRIHLPNHSQVETVNLKALIQDGNLLVETDLRSDVYLEVSFLVP